MSNNSNQMKIGFALKKSKKNSNVSSSNEASSTITGFTKVLNTSKNDDKVFVTDFQAEDAYKKRQESKIIIPLIIQNEWTKQEFLSPSRINAENDVNNEKEGQNDTVKEMETTELIIPMQEGHGDTEKNPAKERLFNAINTSTISSTNKKPILKQNAVPGMDDLDDANEKYRLDVSLRPTELDVHSEAYDKIPIEEFGAAMLRGMGWSGPKENENENEVKMEPRHKLLGLGAKLLPGMDNINNKKNKISASIKSRDNTQDERRTVGLHVKERRKNSDVEYDDTRSRRSTRHPSSSPSRNKRRNPSSSPSRSRRRDSSSSPRERRRRDRSRSRSRDRRRERSRDQKKRSRSPDKIRSDRYSHK